jgi:hypothetical protein
MEKGYIVLTPEKINDLFRDLEISVCDLNLMANDLFLIQIILESKKQELLKQLTK